MKTPAIAVTPISASSTGANSAAGWWPSASRYPATRAAIVATTADVELSGPATMVGTELRSATTAAITAAQSRVIAIPSPRKGASGPEKISAAYDSA